MKKKIIIQLDNKKFKNMYGYYIHFLKMFTFNALSIFFFVFSVVKFCLFDLFYKYTETIECNLSWLRIFRYRPITVVIKK